MPTEDCVCDLLDANYSPGITDVDSDNFEEEDDLDLITENEDSLDNDEDTVEVADDEEFDDLSYAEQPDEDLGYSLDYDEIPDIEDLDGDEDENSIPIFKYRGFVCAMEKDRDGDPIRRLYTRDEWELGDGYRTEEWETESVWESKEWIDSYWNDDELNSVDDEDFYDEDEEGDILEEGYEGDEYPDHPNILNLIDYYMGQGMSEDDATRCANSDLGLPNEEGIDDSGYYEDESFDDIEEFDPDDIEDVDPGEEPEDFKRRREAYPQKPNILNLVEYYMEVEGMSEDDATKCAQADLGLPIDSDEEEFRVVDENEPIEEGRLSRKTRRGGMAGVKRALDMKSPNPATGTPSPISGSGASE
jgi:hypothetical protein